MSGQTSPGASGQPCGALYGALSGGLRGDPPASHRASAAPDRRAFRTGGMDCRAAARRADDTTAWTHRAGRAAVLLAPRWGWDAWATVQLTALRRSLLDRIGDPELVSRPAVAMIVAAKNATHFTSALSETFATGAIEAHRFRIGLPLDEIVAGLNSTGQVSNVRRTNFAVASRTCPGCGTKLKRTVGPGEPWQFAYPCVGSSITCLRGPQAAGRGRPDVSAPGRGRVGARTAATRRYGWRQSQ
jgi:hypothetical protein